MIKAVFFDVGGVLVWDVGPGARVLATRIFNTRLASLLPTWLKLIRKLGEGKITENNFWDTLARAYRLPNRRRRELYKIFPSRKMTKDHRVFGIAKRLRDADYAIGIISDTIPSHAAIHRRVGTYRMFSPIILSHEVGAMKPKKNIFRAAVRRAGVRYSEAVFFDDHREKLVGARELGIKTFVYKNPTQLVRSLRRLGVKI